MSTPSYREIFDRLESSQRLSPEARAAAEQVILDATDDDDSSSLLISLVAGFGAWLSTVFLITLLFAAGIVGFDEPSLLTLAAVMGAGAVAVSKLGLDRNAFTSQLMLAASISAQILLFLAVGSIDLPVRLLGVTAMSAAMYTMIDDEANRLISSGFLAGVLAFQSVRLPVLGAALFSLAVALPCIIFGARRALPSKLRMALRPAAFVGAMLALAITFPSFLSEIADWLPHVARIILSVAAVAMLSLAYLDADADQNSDEHPLVWAAAAVIVLGLVTTPGILCAALLVGLGLWRRRNWLASIGALGLTVHLFIYYYELDLTLLAKSGVLIASGLVLLGLRWIIEHERTPSTEET